MTDSSHETKDGSTIVLYEDKQYYRAREDVYPDAEVIMQDEDAHSIEEPIIAPVEEKTFLTETNFDFNTTYSNEFLLHLSKTPNLIRNIAVLGHLHHGKTRFCDLLVEETLENKWGLEKEMRWLDTRQDEQDREISIKASPMSMALQDMMGKSYMFNVIDTPGHPNFSGEVSAALRLCDGVVLIVDAVEGVQLSTRLLLKHAVETCLKHTSVRRENKVADSLGICLVLSKVDRLINELKLPPDDAYLKLNHVIYQINTELQKILEENSLGIRYKLSPKLNNVVFCSALHGWCFSLKTFALMYQSKFGMSSIDVTKFAKNLWGNTFYDVEQKQFLKTTKKSAFNTSFPRSFVHFILNPLYKIYSYVIGESPKQLKVLLRQLHIKLTTKELKLDVKPLLKFVLSFFFTNCSAFVEMVVENVSSPNNVANQTLEAYYSGSKEDLNSLEASSLVLNIVKHMAYKVVTKKFLSKGQSRGNEFLSLGKVMHGIIREGDKVVVFGENYRVGVDEEDKVKATIKKLLIPLGRHNLPVSHMSSGNWVLIQGLSDNISKSATVIDVGSYDRIPHFAILKPLVHNNSAVVKIAVEPLLPNELPQLVEALKCINKNYIQCEAKIEETGEHAIQGTGEIFLDCVMRDMRELYTDIEIKVADPYVSFRETVEDTSALKCGATSMNNKNKLSMIAEPLEEGLANDIEKGKICDSHIKGSLETKRIMSKYLEDTYHWDVLSARSVWAFGPQEVYGTSNLLLNDVIPSDTKDFNLLDSVRQPIVQGFQWATREGPLCDEPMRKVKFKLIDISLASKGIERSFGQIIPTTRRSIYSSFLTASPRIVEPINYMEAMCTAEVLSNIENVLRSRRGNVIKSEPVPGSPFFLVKGTIPVIDSFGFETDLRIHTKGLGFVLQVFDHWNIVPGDPLDESIILRPLEPSKPIELSREFMVKTRQRKGLGKEVAIRKYFDKDMSGTVTKSEEGSSLLG